MNYSDSSVNTFNERKMIPASSKLPFKFILILLLSDLSSCFFMIPHFSVGSVTYFSWWRSVELWSFVVGDQLKIS